MSAHTPGPWRACHPELWGEHINDVLVDAMEGAGAYFETEVAIVRGQDTAEVRDANVRLILAAPDLLAACEDVRSLAEQMIGMEVTDERSANRRSAFAGAGSKFRSMVMDAIAKAKGHA